MVLTGHEPVNRHERVYHTSQQWRQSASDWDRIPELREAPCLLSRFIVAAVIVLALMSLAAAPAPTTDPDGTAVELPADVASERSEAPIADAARDGDVEAVRTLLRGGEDVNAAHGDGMSALHWAAYGGRAELIDVLVYAGANLEATTRVGAYTPLLVAARTGHGEAVEALVVAGADPTATTSTGVTALHFAAGTGQAGAITALVAAGAPIDAIDDAHGQTPLVFAAERGRLAAVEALLAAGADPALRSRVTVIADLEAEDRVAARLRRERLQTLAELRTTEREAADEMERIRSGEEAEAPATPTADGDTDEPRSQETSDATSGEADAASTEASEAAEVEIFDDLRGNAEEDRDADGGQPEDLPEASETAEPETPEEEPLGYGDLVGGVGGMTALHHAAREGHLETALALVRGGADPNVPAGGDGSTPMLLATINGHFDLALELMAEGADPSLANHADVTPLWAAINVRWAPKALYPQPKNHQRQAIDYLGFMERLLEAGVDPDARVNRHVWFMSYNFDLLGVNMRGATPFWRAAYALDVPAMRLLVEYGADPRLATRKPPERRRGDADDEEEDPSGLPPVPVGGPGVYPIHAASGAGYGQDFAANSHEHAPDGWLPAVRYLVEELGADVNARDQFGYNAIHHAAARGDDELIRWLVEKGADPLAVARNGRTTVDMANGPIQRVEPFPSTIALLESLGAVNNDNCLSCE